MHISEVEIERALPRLKRVAEMYRKDPNLAAIGRELGVSRERARQLVNRARQLGLINES